ncbi:MAG: class I SAM-dependent methyltransferase [Candidatus Thorarchaeota archaeon]
MEKFFKANRTMWDRFARVHFHSEAYRTQKFLAGETTLNSIEIEELGDVREKSLLHLQCHFGLDTLSWARKGARVTGVDFSEEAIRLARKLARESGLEAKFIQANIYELPDIFEETFDVVFTSYGVLCWLNNLKRWAEIIAHFLRPGGIFYIIEFHPLIWVFDTDAEDGFKLQHSYFHGAEPLSFEVDGSYTGEKIEPVTDYEWVHSIGETVNSIIDAGLKIQFLHEFPMSTFQNFPFLKRHDDGLWYYDDSEIQLPLMFSIKAVKE